MAKMTPRKFTKLPWIRELTGSRCEELANELRDAKTWEVAEATPSSPGDVLAIIPQAQESIRKAPGDDGKMKVSLMMETTSERGVITRQQTTERFGHGEIGHIPREDGLAHLARAVVVPRLYGYRSDVIRRVQDEIQRRDGVRMSTSWIESCWDDFCELESTLRDCKE